jgi:lipopolysaccharide transport system permease protein
VLILFCQQPVDLVKALYLWPAGLMLTVIGTLGPGCLLAALNIKYRDFRYVIPFLVQVLLFLTPVIYPMSILKYEWLQYVVALNPMYSAITLFRLPLSGAVPDTMLLIESIASAFVFLLVGIAYFRRTEMYFADLA